MNSRWLDPILAVARKEFQAEWQSKHGLAMGVLFGFVAVVAVAFGAAGQQLTDSFAASSLCTVLLFQGVLVLPRGYIAEDEQKTLDLLRLWAPPRAIVLGKLLFHLPAQVLTTVVILVIFGGLSGLAVDSWYVYLLAGVLESVCITAAVSLCGVLVLGASNRWLLVASLSIPLLLPQLAMALGALRAGISGFPATSYLFGLATFGFLSTLITVMLGAVVLRRHDGGILGE